MIEGASDSAECSEVALIAQEVLVQILGRMRARAKVRVVEGADQVELAISGPDASVVVGNKGQTLDSLQYLLNRIVSRRVGEHKLLLVNADGYREKREAALVDLARRLSEKARSEGKAVALNPMSARDRRVIHLTLKDDPEVCTRSEGEGEERRLLIVPRQEG